jgi:hypothetical protein
MFEITGDDIALLNEEDLRTLVARLCESELRRRHLPLSAVMWGGHQNAADAGLDVRVDLGSDAEIDGFIPRPQTGFQVKKPDMPPAQILKEMRPHGAVRSVICDLANKRGAYIIVSSSASTSDLALGKRRKAMAEALHDVRGADALAFDFYDRTRLATWVRDHAGLILWVKERIGRAVQGWSSYGPWAYAPEGVSGEYLLDDTIRIRTGRYEKEGGISALEGIERMRALLETPGAVVRVVGLSGVGKTRFAQALFDDRLGKESLDPSIAIYTNIADEPNPPPIGIASDLVATQTRVILVIDNCTPELHRRLSEVCRAPESRLSVLTIEYDIREDQPEGTEVFELHPSSDELIERLLKKRFRDLSAVNASTIARSSGGKARIAIVLAATVKQKETITGLRDEELFRRLFQQRHDNDESLLLIGQACSLVHSFNGEDVSDAPTAELTRLGRLIEKTATEMFRGVAELRRRDLVQQRGVWRAILPPAVANRLAATALESIPRVAIGSKLVAEAPERLLTSFSRRLGYLHFSVEAQTIVREWLNESGRLGNLATLDSVGKAMFTNIAPVIPEATLSVLERAFSAARTEQELQKYADYIHLPRSLANEPDLFERSAVLIAKIAEHTGDGNHSNQVRDLFASLFFVHLSGTRAPIERRLVVVERLLAAEDTRERKLGLAGLKAALQTTHFSSFYNFAFGARSRDHGLWPQSQAELKHWFGATLRLTEQLACSETRSATEVRGVLADSFRGLWTNARVYAELEAVCRAISAKQFWPGGWIAVRVTQHFDSKGLPPDICGRLATLEEILRPKDVVQKVRSFVLPSRGGAIDLALEDSDTADIHNRLQQLEATAEYLGREVARDEEAFSELLPEFVISTGRLWSFGTGLAQSADQPTAVWNRLLAQFALTPERERQIHIFSGFLQGLRIKDPCLSEVLLDEAVENETLASWYPILQAHAGVNKRGVHRMLHSLALGKAPSEAYRHLAWGRASECISPHDLSKLLRQIVCKPDGFDVAAEILFMRLDSKSDRKQGNPRELVDVGRHLMRRVKFAKRQDRSDYHLAGIVKCCLGAARDAILVEQICRKLKTAILKHQTNVSGNDDLLHALLSVYPRAALDGLFVGKKGAVAARLIRDLHWLRSNPFDVISENELLEWCNQEPQIRYPLAAAAITFATEPDASGRRHWTSVALQLLKHAPDRGLVLKELIAQFTPMSWSGSLAAALESNLRLLDDLENYPDPKLAPAISQNKIELSRMIERERLWEAEQEKQRDERFE